MKNNEKFLKVREFIKRRKRLFVFLCFIFVIAFFSFYISYNPSSQVEPTGSPAPTYKPLEFGVVLPSSLVTSSITSKDFLFPERIPLIKSSPFPPLSKGKVVDVGRAYNFTGEPLVNESRLRGTTYTWFEGNRSLVVYGATGLVDFSIDKSPAGITRKDFSDKELIDTAIDALSKTGMNMDDVAFSFFSYFVNDGGYHGMVESNKQQGNVIQINFTSRVSQYPLMTVNPQKSYIYVNMLTDGSIVRIYANSLSNFSLSKDTYKVKNFDEFSSTLSQAQLISLNDGEVFLPDYENLIENVNISEVSLAYLLDSVESKNILPVFLLRGRAKLKGGESTNAFMYLPAISRK